MSDTVGDEKADAPKLPACRLYAILARTSSSAVIFRRGPSKWVQIIKWDTSKDTFTPGQWFTGRVYERRCDVSPDGSLLIYFAQKLNSHTIGSNTTYAWTAISKLPYLTALALWPKGDCWDGGGLFQSNQEIWLNHPPDKITPHPDHDPGKLKITANEKKLGEDEPILMRRLLRDDWRQTQEWQVEYTYSNRGFVTHVPRLMRKQNPSGWQKLTLTTSVTGYKTENNYSVRYTEGKDRVLSEADWADWDHRGRLVYAREGRLYIAALTGDVMEDRQLADFNQNKPEPIEAPEWAKRW